MRSRWHYILRGFRECYYRKLVISVGTALLISAFLIGAAFAAGISGSGNYSGEEAARTASGTTVPTEKKTTTSTTRPPETGGQSTKRARRKPPSGGCSDPLVVVDRQRGLPRDYAPQNLVSLSAYGVPTLGGKLLKEAAARHLARMVEDAGMELVVASAYRSYFDQQSAYAYWSSYYRDGNAGGASAPPGHSEHQLGTTVDFTNAAAGYEVTRRFGYTEAGRWLRQNAWRYGFAPSYPRNRMEETGYVWEPWHYRYIGVENAREWHESGIVLHEFLQRNGVRPGC